MFTHLKKFGNKRKGRGWKGEGEGVGVLGVWSMNARLLFPSCLECRAQVNQNMNMYPRNGVL
jgi:hypothetical protein